MQNICIVTVENMVSIVSGQFCILTRLQDTFFSSTQIHMPASESICGLKFLWTESQVNIQALMNPPQVLHRILFMHILLVYAYMAFIYIHIVHILIQMTYFAYVCIFFQVHMHKYAYLCIFSGVYAYFQVLDTL